MKVSFNTGRKYTVHGQRIVATLHEDLVVTFHDIDRMIRGEFTLNPKELRHWMLDKDTAARMVMRRYDNNLYQWTRRSDEDAQGCNTWDLQQSTS